ncbi:glycosyltransferase family 2 protein, partial [Brachyspira catarrhinii]
MNNNMKISVIVPSYNSERYISRCLNSLINQTYKNLEIIIIDDYSTDNSCKIIEEFQKKYNNIIFLKNEENKKTFETRRIGMEAATGDYIGFCDADDFHEPYSFEYLLNLIQ